MEGRRVEKLNYLNVGCGNKFHKQWFNVDMKSNSKYVIEANILKGIPFSDNQFDVVYHSQVLEHFPKENAQVFMSECFRVLKTGGIIRIVVPNLENIVGEYLKHLNDMLEKPNEVSAANYEWIMLELYDQTVRNYSGGQMAEYLKRSSFINEEYINSRIGRVGRDIKDNFLKEFNSRRGKKAFYSVKMFKKAIRYIFSKIIRKIIPQSKASKIGAFRLGGQIHMWMYDRYSLAELLKKCGFVDISIKNPFESGIPDWKKYELDVKDGLVCDPTSLFMEARKGPAHNRSDM
jgi:predicted SAM-dependent methyltransferase